MKPVFQFSLSDHPLDAQSLVANLQNPQAGAVLHFEGRVRNHNEGYRVSKLEYQAYPALAIATGNRILNEECERHGVLCATAVHRTGAMEIGDVAVWVGVASEHRGAAFSATQAIMERLKYELPIWKKESYEDGSSEWVGPDNTSAATGLPHEEVPTWRAELLEIWISPMNDFRGHHGMPRGNAGITRVPEIECVAGMGLKGDRYFGFKPDYKGQVTFFDTQALEAVREHFDLPELVAGEFRRNILVRGVRLEDWIGKRFFFQGIEFEGSEECKPCYWMNEAIAPGAEDFMKMACRGGLRARILSDGVLRELR